MILSEQISQHPLLVSFGALCWAVGIFLLILVLIERRGRKCGECPSCYGKGRYSLQFEDGGLCDRCGGTGREGTK